MTVPTVTNGKPARKQLSDQLDRLDGLIDTLAEALPQAVACAAQAWAWARRAPQPARTPPAPGPGPGPRHPRPDPRAPGGPMPDPPDPPPGPGGGGPAPPCPECGSPDTFYFRDPAGGLVLICQACIDHTPDPD